MVNITHKSNTLRKAIAQAIVKVSKPETLDAIRNRAVPKGDVLEMSKTAGLFAAKRTSDMIPDCHPLPIEYTRISYELHDLSITIKVEIHTIYKTGVEVEAMHAASVVALTIYDMLKPIDKGIEIEQIKLLEKKGGKSDPGNKPLHTAKTALLVVSNSIASGKKENEISGIVGEFLAKHQTPLNHEELLPDDAELLKEKVIGLCHQDFNLLLISGGTGLVPTDCTYDVLKQILDTDIPGIAEAMRHYGQQRTPKAMFSRSIAGYLNNVLVLALPGSKSGAQESLQAIFPAVLDALRK